MATGKKPVKIADATGHCGPGAYWYKGHCRDVVDDHIVPRIAVGGKSNKGKSNKGKSINTMKRWNA